MSLTDCIEGRNSPDVRRGAGHVIVRVRLHLTFGLTNGKLQLAEGPGWEYASSILIYRGYEKKIW